MQWRCLSSIDPYAMSDCTIGAYRREYSRTGRLRTSRVDSRFLPGRWRPLLLPVPELLVVGALLKNGPGLGGHKREGGG